MKFSKKTNAQNLPVNELSLFFVTLGWNTLSPILGENIPVTG